ncbi:MAG: hypothetical protein KAT90_03935 [Gammaproteobacteria bacterium]|nr:hypothetical protein [Gammaproteobacteria bacterium]
MFVKLVTRFFILLVIFIIPVEGNAEYGDVVLNNFSDEINFRPVIFPHWFHRIRYTCKVCHDDLEFKLKAGANKINMSAIINGRYCGACHNGKIAWDIENCDLCHSAVVGTKTKIHRSSQQKILDVRERRAKKPVTSEQKKELNKK